MIRFSRLRTFKWMFFCAMFLGVAANAKAGTIEIQFSGLNLVYDGTDIFDATSVLGRNGDPAESDKLTSMSILIDGELVGSVLEDDIFADVLIDDVLNIPVAGGSVTSLGGSFFDLLTKDVVTGWGLALDIDTIKVFYSGNKIFIGGGGIATNLFAQDLPFDVEFDPTQEIKISFASAALTNVTSAGGFLTGFSSSGTGNVRGTEFIPEPATFALAMLGILCALCQQRTRNSSPINSGIRR